MNSTSTPTTSESTASVWRTLGEQLYGPGLIARVYIAELARNLDLPQERVRKWWYGLEAESSPALTELIERIPPITWDTQTEMEQEVHSSLDGKKTCNDDDALFLSGCGRKAC